MTPGETNRRIGLRISEARENANFSQEDLGQRIGETQQVVAKYESGNLTRGVPIHALKKIAYALGVSVGWLLEETDDPSVDRIVTPDADFNEIYTELSRDDQTRVHVYAMGLHAMSLHGLFDTFQLMQRARNDRDSATEKLRKIEALLYGEDDDDDVVSS